jgi:hypothetical protein
VNSLKRGLIVVFFSLGLLGVAGCSADNETEANKLAKDMGDPGKASEAKSALPSLPPAKTQKEYFERQVDPGKQMGGNYPGSEKKRN